VHLLLGILKALDPALMAQGSELGFSENDLKQWEVTSAMARHYLELGDKRITRVRRTIRSSLRNGRTVEPGTEIAILHRDEDSRKAFAYAACVAKKRGAKAISFDNLLEALFETELISLKHLRASAKPSSDGARWSVE
jgi:hypothetical protein